MNYDDEINTVFSHSTPAIATCRPDKMGAKDQLERLTAAIKAGAAYVDIEIEAERKLEELANKGVCIPLGKNGRIKINCFFSFTGNIFCKH